jgi:predicted phosphohydrolase
MRVRILSDLHFEFHADHGVSFVNSIEKNNQDVVLIAGDISNSIIMEKSIQLVCSYWDPVPVIYVAGNHDYYLSCISTVLNKFRQLEREIHNFKFLENDIISINGRRILGTTLWFDHSGQHELYDNFMTDFSDIGDIYSSIQKLGVFSIDFLRQEIKPGDIVLTHHMPHRVCIIPKFIGSPLNKYFVHYGAERIIENASVTWIHGHTHAFIDQKFDFLGDGDESRIICNAFGYVGEENTDFKPDLILKL